MIKHPQGWCALALACLLAGCEFGTQGEPAPKAGSSEQQAAQPIAVPSSADDVAEGATDQSAGPNLARGHLDFVAGYAAGYRKAIDESKPMLVFFTAEWCHFCHQMANEAFTNDQVVELSHRFVCILVDADAEPQVCQQFRVQGFPTIQFLSPRGLPLNRIVGKKPGHQLMMAMQAALQNVARRLEANESVRK